MMITGLLAGAAKTMVVSMLSEMVVLGGFGYACRVGIGKINKH